MLQKDAYDIRVRRPIIRRHLNKHKTWGERWKIAHDKLQMLYCDTLFYPTAFAEDTSGIGSSINTMLIILQQEVICASLLGLNFKEQHYFTRNFYQIFINCDSYFTQTKINHSYLAQTLI